MGGGDEFEKCGCIYTDLYCFGKNSMFSIETEIWKLNVT